MTTTSPSPPRELSVPHVRKAVPPQHLNVVYPNLELLAYLTRCNHGAQKPLQPRLSDQLATLAAMDGEEMLNFFHSNVAQIGFENEELHHLLWTPVVPYVNPTQEVLTCVLVSTSAVYFVSDDAPRPQTTARIPQIRKGHSRNRSDPAHYLPAPGKTTSKQHHVSGILHEGAHGTRGVLQAYYTLPLKELQEIHLGLFDQHFRLVGPDASSVLACACRDSQLTEMFVRRLMGVLSRVHPSPSPDPQTLADSAAGLEQDFYKMFSKQISQSESLEYVHPSRVRFVYPNDDLLADVTFVIAEGAQGGAPPKPDTQILSYALVLTQRMDGTEGTSTPQYHPRSLVLTQNYLALMIEDVVSFPLPHFAKSPPVSEHHVVQQVREISSLKQMVATASPGARDLTLVFLSSSDKIEVDPSSEYYSSRKKTTGMMTSATSMTSSTTSTTTAVNQARREYSWSLVVQAEHERQRLIKSIRQQWSAKHDGQELPLELNVHDALSIK